MIYQKLLYLFSDVQTLNFSKILIVTSRAFLHFSVEISNTSRSKFVPCLSRLKLWIWTENLNLNLKFVLVQKSVVDLATFIEYNFVNIKIALLTLFTKQKLIYFVTKSTIKNFLCSLCCFFYFRVYLGHDVNFIFTEKAQLLQNVSNTVYWKLNA